MTSGRVWVRWTGDKLVYIFTVLDVTIVYDTELSDHCDLQLVIPICNEDTGPTIITMHDAPALFDMVEIEVRGNTRLAVDKNTYQLDCYNSQFDESWRWIRTQSYNYYQPHPSIGMESIADQVEQLVIDQIW